MSALARIITLERSNGYIEWFPARLSFRHRARFEPSVMDVYSHVYIERKKERERNAARSNENQSLCCIDAALCPRARRAPFTHPTRKLARRRSPRPFQNNYAFFGALFSHVSLAPAGVKIQNLSKRGHCEILFLDDAGDSVEFVCAKGRRIRASSRGHVEIIYIYKPKPRL